MRTIVALALLLVSTAAIAETGIASIYWGDPTTSSGELPNRKLPTVAHRTLPAGTCLNVVVNGITCRVRVNDCGPCCPGGPCSRSNTPASHRARERLLDIGEKAARCLGVWKENPSERGLARVYFWRVPCSG